MEINDFITKSSRNKNVSEYEYGNISGFDIDSYDIPVKAKFEYNSNNEVVYENYDELILFIDNNLIPNYIIKKEMDSDIYYIRLIDILKEKFSEREVKFIIEYLGKKNIYVLGYATSLEGYFDNYICIRNSGRKNSSIDLPAYSLSSSLEKELFLEYKNNPSLELKQKIALDNSRLVLYQAFYYSRLFDIDVDELFGYGMIGLLKSIPLFDVTLEKKFSTYAMYWIKRYIISGVNKMRDIPLRDGNIAYSFSMNYKKGEKNGELYLLEDIIQSLIDSKVINDTLEERNSVINWYKLNNYIDLSELVFNSEEDLILYGINNDISDKPYCDSDLTFDKACYGILKNDIDKVLDILDERIREILKMRYGLSPYDKVYSLDKIGKLYGMSHENVRKLEKKGINKLKKCYKRRVLEDYYN